MRERQRRERLEALRIEAHHLGVCVVRRARADDRADLVRDIWTAGGNREDLHADAGLVHRLDANRCIGSMRGVRAAPAHRRFDLAVTERVDQVEVGSGKIVSVNVDAHVVLF